MAQGKDTQGLAKARLSWVEQGLPNVVTLMVTSMALQKEPCRGQGTIGESSDLAQPQALQADLKPADQLNLGKPSGFPGARFAGQVQVHCNFSSVSVAGCSGFRKGIVIPKQPQQPFK